MHAAEVIESYIDDTVRLLPGRQRDDVAAELRTLLMEELLARAEDSGRPADEALALSLVRGYGRPNEVAARYQPEWTIVDAADSKSFLRAAVIGTSVLALLSALRMVRRPDLPSSSNDGGVSAILAWLGFLVVGFGLKGWIRRRWPATSAWKPRDRERANRVGTAIVVPVAAFCVLLYAAPTWVLDRISGGRLETSWSAYTPTFERFRLPGVIGLMIGLLALLSFAAIQGRWSRITRRIDLGLNMALALLVLSIAVEGNIFRSSKADQIARDVLALVAVFYVSGVGAILYGEIGRVRRAVAAKDA